MGSPKADVTVAGRTMLHWVREALDQVTPESVVVGGAEFPDRFGGAGPLAGLASVLEMGRPVLTVAVDQPWVRAETLRLLVTLEPASIPMAGGSRQVTCATYPAEWASETVNELQAGGSVQSLLDRLSHNEVKEDVWRGWGEDGRSWFSADTEEAVGQGLARYGSPGGS